MKEQIEGFVLHELSCPRERLAIEAPSDRVTSLECSQRAECIEPTGDPSHPGAPVLHDSERSRSQIARGRLHVRLCRRRPVRQCGDQCATTSQTVVSISCPMAEITGT